MFMKYRIFYFWDAQKSRKQKKKSKTKEMRISKKIGVFFEIVAILANVDLNLRLKICKLAF